MPGIAKTGEDRLAEPLSRQQRAAPGRGAPPQQSPDDSEIRDGVDPKRRDDAVGRNRHAADRRTECARNVHADAVGGDSRRQIVLGNECRHDRLPSGYRQCSGCADQECEEEQIAGRRQIQVRRSRHKQRTRPSSAISTTIRNLRLSKISASAPAGIANKQIGKVLAACTSATISGSGLRLVISQPEAALYIQPPTLETKVAVQMTANAR